MSEQTGAKRRNNDEEGGTAAWMVTFSDLSTLLLTFFVLLLSMASMDDRSLKTMFSSFTDACGILYFKELGEIYQPKEVLIDGIYEQLEETLMVKRAAEPIPEIVAKTEETPFDKIAGFRIEDLKKGFKVVFGHELLFSSGSAAIKEEMKPVLDKVAKFINTTHYRIYIDGHTDNVPIHSARYSSNEDLSLARSFSILDYFVATSKVDPSTIAITGYGELRPIASNFKPEGRRKNRRVEIIFKNQKYF
jgi:chemotaxis protein MotB